MLRGLAAGDDEDVAAIACYDIGEFVRHYPNGRAIAKQLGVRNVVMSLIEHQNPELQRQALQCVSKMLVQNWQVRVASGQRGNISGFLLSPTIRVDFRSPCSYSPYCVQRLWVDKRSATCLLIRKNTELTHFSCRTGCGQIRAQLHVWIM